MLHILLRLGRQCCDSISKYFNYFFSCASFIHISKRYEKSARKSIPLLFLSNNSCLFLSNNSCLTLLSYKEYTVVYRGKIFKNDTQDHTNSATRM